MEHVLLAVFTIDTAAVCMALFEDEKNVLANGKV